ncbi:hypothetical protein [Actinophytocola glycyrrhizae]|uniref:Uncharacterized protein n=1 Tax=Actinophytocola glycyrrhizae TaxID=2044873 RepID=A0ABV9S0M7_9PSEU
MPPRLQQPGTPDKYAGHEKAAYIREDSILDAVSKHDTDRVFGPHRRELLAADLASTDDRETRQREAERGRLQRTLADLARRQDNVMRQAQDCAPDDPFDQGLRQTYNDLETAGNRTPDHPRRRRRTGRRRASRPPRPTAEDVDLLDTLPYLTLNLTEAPVRLHRELFETTHPDRALHPDSDDVTISIRLPAEGLPTITDGAERIINTMDTAQERLLIRQARLVWMQVVPPVGAPKDGNRADQRFRSGCLVVQASFVM